MANFVNFVCWTAANVVATIPTEAATPSDAVLLATHAPLRISRRGGSATSSSESLTEEELLQEFLTSEPNNGVLVATILGESGAGKSHLVRWANAKIERKPRRHIVYLQKTETSLKDVVERLLLDRRDAEFDELRRRVSGLGSGMTPDEMEHKILAELAEALRTAEADNPYGRALVGENGLRLFFTDPLFERHLLRNGSFIKRRAEHALRGRSTDESDVPLEFTADELPTDIGDYADIREAAHATQNLFRKMVANEAYQSEAVRLLNSVLDIAVTKAASLAVGDISQAFKRLREKLVGDEIIVLIEDVALIQGVRRDLLDAITEVGVVQGKERFATVRTLLAVTPGYYIESLPETFRRRSEATSPVYVVDVDLDSSSVDEDDLVDFVGRYLNAARVGKVDLESAAPTVPNQCLSCKFRPQCHEAFGTSRQDYGLYPYNRVAILRAVRACADKDRDRTYFNPRKVLSRAVRQVLTEASSSIPNSVFPPGDLLAEESRATGLPVLPRGARELIERDYSGDAAGRLTALLTFWGRLAAEAPNTGVLHAFSHPPIPADLLSAADGTGTPGDEIEESPGPADALPPSLRRDLQAVEQWSEGKPLPQALANDMRKIIREALVNRIQFLDIAIKDPDSQTLNKAIPENARGVSIEGANENIAVGVAPIIRISRTAHNAGMVIGLVYIKAGFPERAADALPRLDSLIADVVEEAQRRVLNELEAGDEALTQAAAALIRGAAACGEVGGKPKEADLIRACLWLPKDANRADADARAPQWLSAYQAYIASRGDAVKRFTERIGVAQGTGAVHALDIRRLAKIVKQAAKVASAESDLDVPSWCIESHRLLKQLVRAAQVQLELWSDLVTHARRHLPVSATWIETVDAVADAAKVGRALGLVKVADLHRLDAQNTEARAWDGAALKRVESLVEAAEAAAGYELTRIAGTDCGAELKGMVDFLESSSAWVEAGLLQADSGGGQLADLDAEIEKTIQRWSEILKEGSDG